MHRPTTPRKTRARDIHEAHRVSSPLELLFDLSFVVAIATTASQLHHDVMHGHLLHGLGLFVVGFFGVWWAWMNFTWFASAYDNDDTTFRLLTLVQMAGVVLYAAGLQLIAQNDFRGVVMGYLVMRLALVVQWLRAARDDPKGRPACMRYAIGIAALQAAWVARLGAPPALAWPIFCALAALEMLVPVWAERAAHTPWHPHHIAERYGLFTLIVLGEGVLGASNALNSVLLVQGWTLDVALVGLGATALIFSLWWGYFMLPSGEALHRYRHRAFAWGYWHALIFAALGVIGAGLEVVADVIKAGDAHQGITPTGAIAVVAAGVAAYMLGVWIVYRHATHADQRQRLLLVVCLACVGAVVALVHAGLGLGWALCLMPLGPSLAVAYNERGRRLNGQAFAVK